MFVVILFVIFVFVNGAPALWNITTDPYPPYQPAEMGCSVYNYQNYHLVSNNEVILDLNVPGYEFFSYSQLSTMSTSEGEVNGVPNLQISYGNYADPSSNEAQLLVYYNTQTCLLGPIEGNSPYIGYDYYTNLLLSLYNSGIPVYFEYVNIEPYGVCLQYTATPPWVSNDDSQPRDITYTVTFQNSTGYLVIYALTGTEYCCPGENIYCPNSGLCPDGSTPLLTFANTTQVLDGYQIFTNTSWAPGFFGAYCPFDTCSNSKHGSSIEMAMATLFGVLLLISLLILYHLHNQLKLKNDALLKNNILNSSM